jgi:uncharacterized membrane protein
MENLKDYQALVGACVALLAALIGFSGVIYSQRRIAKVAEDGRAHQEKMSMEQGERQRRSERMSFLNAILGELSALQLSIANSIKILLAQISIAEELARMNNGRKTQPRVVFRFATPVFDSHVARIGLLSPELSFRVSNLFGQFKSYSTQAMDQVPEMEPALAVRIMRSVHESLQRLHADTEELKTALGASIAA